MGAFLGFFSGLISCEGEAWRRGEVAHGGRARGEMGGCTREQCGSNKRCAPLKT